MSKYQWMIVVLCILLNTLDGFDIQAMAFTSTGVRAEFDLTGAQLGVLLSAGLVGMALGSLLLAPFGDVIGRRALILLSVSLSTVGPFMVALSGSPIEIGIWRVVTGLGVGGILACATVMVSEYSSIRWRGLAISLYAAGYGIGAALGGLISIPLLAEFGWRSVFLVSGGASVIILVLLVFLLPESVNFLMTKRPRNALVRLNRIARRIGQPELTGMPDPGVSTGERTESRRANPVKELLSPEYRSSTLLIWSAFFIIMFGFYFVNSWTPELLVTAGLSEQEGVTGGLMLAAGGAVGASCFGFLAARWDSRSILIVFTVFASVSMVLLILLTGTLALAYAAGLLAGAFINGCIAGLYTIVPALYDADVRSTGVGWGIGIGRFGAISAPTVAGLLQDGGWSPVQLYLGAGAVVLIAALLIWDLRRRSRAAVPQAVA